MIQILKKLLFLLMLISGTNLMAGEQYICHIKSVSQLNENGYFVKHGWSANYMNREFTVDAESGSVLSTTALKQRLNNDTPDSPSKIINRSPFRVLTQFESDGSYSLLEIRNDRVKGKDNIPYFYITEIGMVLGGTCSLNNN